jgi:DNA processing protein
VVTPKADGPDSALQALVACSLLRPGDTLVSRVFAGLSRTLAEAPPNGQAALSAVVERLPIPVGERAVRRRAAFEEAGRALARAKTAGLSVVTIADTAYPPLLRVIPDPPIVLWVRGRIESDPPGILGLSAPAVAIVGSREASTEGLALARHLGRGLSAAGLTIVSGLARGIDAAAHAGALAAEGRTVAVLGSGADRVYPLANVNLAERLLQGGGSVISEQPPGMPALPHHFPLRNRIISGLSRAVVVVEASDRSGSLITARAALEQGRDVLVVPGAVGSGRFKGSHALIKDGAALVETVEDVLDELGWRKPAVGGTTKLFGDNVLQQVMPPGLACSLDELVERTGLPPAEVLSELTALEMAGQVERSGGGRFVRLDGPAMDR